MTLHAFYWLMLFLTMMQIRKTEVFRKRVVAKAPHLLSIKL